MEEFKPKRKNTAQPAQNGQSAPHTRKPRTPKPQGENAANAQHKPAARAPRPRPLPSRTPPRRASQLRVRAARARIRTALHPRTVRLPHRAPRASAADAVQRARSILR